MKYSWIVYSILHVSRASVPYSFYYIFCGSNMFLLLPPIIYTFHLKNFIVAKRRKYLLIFISDDNFHAQCIIPVAIKLGILRN